MVDLSIVIPIAGIAAFATAAYLARYVMRQDAGSEKIREVAEAIREGARAFMKRQYTTIAIIAAALAVVFAAALGAGNLVLGAKTAFAFALGSAFSAISGYIGMHISIRANQRCAAAAQSSYNAALKTALRGGAVSGLAIVAMSLLGVSLLYYLYGWGAPTTGVDAKRAQTDVILSMVGFGFGASLVALFAQLGGGIYTKAADVGADLFESTAAENIGAMVLGAILFPYFGVAGILFPLVARAFGLIASIVGVFVVRTKEEEAPMRALNRGYWVTTILAAIFFGFVAYGMLEPFASPGTDPISGLPYPAASNLTWVYYFACGIIGIASATSRIFSEPASCLITYRAR